MHKKSLIVSDGKRYIRLAQGKVSETQFDFFLNNVINLGFFLLFRDHKECFEAATKNEVDWEKVEK